MANTIRLPQLAWHGTKELELILPDQWQVEICNMAGHNSPAIGSADIGAVIKNPIGCPPIRDLARGKKEVAIIFDDMSRITRVAQIVPFVLQELAEAGVSDSSIRFVAATACHGAMNRFDFVKKLGGETLTRFPVYNHNPFGNCIYAGTTSYGTDIFVNAEVMSCDFKIAIGSIVPHVFAGFGGGTKIVMPGITSIETTEAFHRLGMRVKEEYPDKPVGIGILEDNPLRLNMEEASEMVGLNIIIDTLFNTWGETVAVYAGHPKVTYRTAVKEAQKHYLTPRAKDKDIVIANTFAKANEAEGGLVTAFSSVKKQGGDIVLICNVPEGHVIHYLMGPWGKSKCSDIQLQFDLPTNVNRLIVFNEYPDFTIMGYFKPVQKVSLVATWQEALDLLKESHGHNTQIAVYPMSEIQYCESYADTK